MLNGTPMPKSGSMMSAYSTAASTPNSSTGISVTLAHSSGVRVMVRMSYVSRSSRYAARQRPAWRMNHTGVRSTGWRRAAARKRVAPVMAIGDAGAVVTDRGYRTVTASRPARAGQPAGVDARLARVERVDEVGKRVREAAPGGLGGDRGGDGGRDRAVEHRGDDVLGVEIVADRVGDGPGRRQLHGVGDLAGAAVEQAAEEAREAEDVVDLVGVVAAPGGDHGGDALDGLRLHLRLRVGEREHDRQLGHALHQGTGRAARRVLVPMKTSAPVSASSSAPAMRRGLVWLAYQRCAVAQLGEVLVDDPGAVDADDVADAGGEQQAGHRRARRRRRRGRRRARPRSACSRP